MKHKAWSSIEEVPYCFSRSSVKFQGHIALKIVEFDPNWTFPDCNSSLNSPMAMKCCTKLETAKVRCPIVFQGHPSNFKVTRDKKNTDFDPNWAFRTIGRSQLSNPSDLPCFELGFMCSMLKTFHVLSRIEASISEPPLLSSQYKSLGLVGGKHYQKIIIPMIRLVFQNFAIPGYLPYSLFYHYPFSLLFSGWFVIGVCGSASVRELSMSDGYCELI